MDESLREHMKRHVGTVKNTGARIVLVYRKLPDDNENCLVIMTDALPDQYIDVVLGLVNSREAQETVDLFNVMYRHSFGNGSNILQTMHEQKFLVKMPVDSIDMQLFVGKSVPLRLVNESIDGVAPKSEEPKKEFKPLEVVPDPEPISKEEQAQLLVSEAELLELRAKELREQANALNPVKLKAKVGRPKSDSATDKVTKRNAERKAKTVKPT